jgi:hypothetical protein
MRAGMTVTSGTMPPGVPLPTMAVRPAAMSTEAAHSHHAEADHAKDQAEQVDVHNNRKA